MTAVAGRAMRGLALAQIRHVAAAPPGRAGSLGDAVYRQMEREFGLIAPPVALHTPAPETMAACWLMLRESLVVPGLAGRPVKETVASAVSLTNTCPYCVTVHSATVRGYADGRSAARLADGRFEDVADPVLRAAALWAGSSVDRDPAPTVPFPHEQAPEYLAVALTFHYINRMVNVFLEDAPMPPGAPRRGLAAVERVLSAMIRSAGRRVQEPGTSLDLLPAAELPRDLRWADGSPSIAQALARAAAAFDRAGRRSVPEPVRELVLADLADWDGRASGISRAWTDRLVARVPVADRPAARLSLLTARASYQVDDSVVREYRADGTDEQLVELAAWSAFAAARRATSLLVAAGSSPVGRVGSESEG